MESIEIKREQDDNGSRFILYAQGEYAGRVECVSHSTTEITIAHTYVDDKFAGKGVGKTLVMAVVEYANQNQLAIIPECSFAKKMIDNMAM